MKGPNAKQSILRRYPALLLLVAAGLLAVLLPSALNVPQSPPTSLAEFAPIPGEGQGSSQASSYGQSESGSLGFGSGSGDSGRAATPPEKSVQQRRARLKRCVGNPPRQTEDPLSPPCVSFFEGDNGGATAKGVTRDEVRVVLFATPRAGDQPTFVDCLTPPDPLDLGDDTVCKGFNRFFNDRYQTYGRTVRVWNFHPLATAGGSEIAVEVTRADSEKTPFALVTASRTSEPQIVQEAARRKIIGVRYSGDDRMTFAEFAPYIIGFRPDREDQISNSASYVCDKLANRPARFSGNVEDRQRPRVFGFVANNGRNNSAAAPFDQELRDRCGASIRSFVASGAANSGPLATQMRADGVTTGILWNEQNNIFNGANQSGWFPEWVVPGDLFPDGKDTNASARAAQYRTQWANAMGMTFDYRREAVPDQAWYRAFREGCSGCPEPSDVNSPYIYESFNMLFWGIQAAGPRLTSQSLDKGLHAIPPRRSSDPYVPAAYFASGNYTFIKDAASMWWDPEGQAPGDSVNSVPGCWRLIGGGQRYRAGEWPRTDDDIRRPGAPCQGSTRAS